MQLADKLPVDRLSTDRMTADMQLAEVSNLINSATFDESSNQTANLASSDLLKLQAATLADGVEVLDLDDAAFLKSLQENMIKLMSPQSSQTLQSNQNTGEINDGSKPPGERKMSEKKDFQDTISQTLDKLKNSSTQAKEGNQGNGMSSMLEELEGMMEGKDFNEMFDGIASQLASRDLLYEVRILD